MIYANQTKNVLGLHLSFASRYGYANTANTTEHLEFDQSRFEMDDHHATMCGVLEHHIEMLNEEAVDEYLNEEYMRLRQCYETGIHLKDVQRMYQPRR